ncbi:MAG: hypothetical protein H0X64_03550 [Gemmatimonadaceae bacterium]|nr:hypothetical protein [Gemmatimonadaceae bacterium]
MAKHRSAAPVARTPRFQHVPWLAVLTGLLLVLGAAFSTLPVRDVVSRQPVREVSLDFSPAYLLLSPLWDVLDHLTLLTVPQHIALLVSLLFTLAAWRGFRAWSRRKAGVPPASPGRAVTRELLAVAAFLAAFVAVYGYGAIGPRPMAELQRREQAVLAVDVHAHTRHSHDGRPGWTAEDVRQWHAASGFDAVYIADHRTFEGVIEAQGNNPARAGERTIILSALEAVYRGEHVNVLSAGRKYSGIATDDLRDLDTTAVALASLIPGAEPVLVQTFPGDFHEITPASGPGTPGIRAIEIIDGAPRGLRQTRANRTRIIRLSDSLDITLVAGSNNHGWGRTAPGWTLFRLEGWQDMSAAELADNLERQIRDGGRRATRVVERVGTETEGRTLALTLPALAWRITSTLTFPQRVSWFVWTAAVTAVVVVRRRSVAATRR